MNREKAVVLLSGGIDSSTTLAIALSQEYEVIALSFEYGQRHRIELDSARKVAASLKVRDHKILNINLRQIGGSALTDVISVPKQSSERGMRQGIPITYVPARNTIFLSYALAVAEVTESKKIFIGANAIDYSGYPDCRPEFIRAFEKMANLATKSGVEGNEIKIETPLIDLTKAEIIKQGCKLGIDYSLTFSCYDPTENGLACGKCDSCLLRKKGFGEAGIPDPTRYAEQIKV